MTEFIIPIEQPIVYLDCEDAFKSLTDKEKFYSHYLSQASWYGSLIVLYQTSPESPLIYLVLQGIYSSRPLDSLKSLALSNQCSFSDAEFKALLVYSCGIFSNMGNYKGFGDTKFIPNLPKEKLDALIRALDNPQLNLYWDKCKDAMYSLEENVKHLGFAEKGITTYFSKNCGPKDSDLVNHFFKEKGLEAYNTRLFKDSLSEYEIRLASVALMDDNEDSYLVGVHQLSSLPDYKFTVTRGDYSPLLERVNSSLQKAKEYVANSNQQHMLDNYIHSFHTGSLNHHKEGSRFWIKDKGPVVESYIGFIETYRDPAGMRGEFEGFVAIVNKSMSRKFADLVERAEKFLPLLPWPAEFEKDEFLRPDFTSLDVLTFAGSGIPSGICIPNYEEIRQNEGFKNVSLGNVIPLSYQNTTPNFLSLEDQMLFTTYVVPAYELQVGLHELLGHGSGKLFQRNIDGTFNFDFGNVKNPLTGKKVSTFYDIGETYDSVFLALGSPYEECRAESVGLFLSTEPEVLKIFGYEGEEASHIMYINWLTVVHYGLEGLSSYDPTSKSWLQAHSQASFVILRWLQMYEAVKITPVTGSDGKPDLLLTLPRHLIETNGKNAMWNLLFKIQVYKSTADVIRAKDLFDSLSEVDETFVSYRKIVLDRKKPRKIFVQANTFLKDGAIHLKDYESSPEGLVRSWVDRFGQDDSLHNAMFKLWETDYHYFTEAK